MSESHKKGNDLEFRVTELIEGIIVSVGAKAEVVNHPLVIGKSTRWHPDLVLKAHALLDPLEGRSLELAIIECKYIDEASSEGTYWSQMSRAYMSLNDMRLADITSNFYLVVTKRSGRNYSDVFKNIGVKLVNVNVQEELSEFKSSLRQLLEENSFDEQLEKLKQSLQEHGSIASTSKLEALNK